MNKLSLSLLLLVTVIAASAAVVTVKRDRTYLRQGAGPYYKVISQIPVDTSVKLLNKSDAWLQVKYNEDKGYISTSSTVSKAVRNDIFSSIQKSSAQGFVSQHSISAGVKGFADKFNARFKGKQELVDYLYNYAIDPVDFVAFNKVTYKKHKDRTFRQLFPLPQKDTPDYFMEAHEGFGLAVAAIIAAQGLYHNPQLQEYVNYLGHTVVAASDGIDINFRFFILDLMEPNAYACPGGYIFITKGMLQLITDEAELAFVLAHEIAHVTRFHGMIEAKAREHQIGSEDVFAELDTDLPDAFSDEAKELEAELEDEIMTMYETLIQGRLDAYEQEADTLGLLYTARTGYFPSAAVMLIDRLINTRYESNNQHYRRESVKLRSTWLATELLKYRGLNVSFFDHKQRWEKHKALLDR